MSIERARAHLQKHGLADRIIELDVSSATVALAAQALNCESNRIAKTLSFSRGEGAILAGGESLPIAKGQSLFIPAGMGDYRLAGDMTLLRTTL